MSARGAARAGGSGNAVWTWVPGAAELLTDPNPQWRFPRPVASLRRLLRRPEAWRGLAWPGADRRGPTRTDAGRTDLRRVAIPGEVAGLLEAQACFGRPTAESSGYARLYMIVRKGDRWVGAADPRHDGEVRGY